MPFCQLAAAQGAPNDRSNCCIVCISSSTCIRCLFVTRSGNNKLLIASLVVRPCSCATVAPALLADGYTCRSWQCEQSHCSARLEIDCVHVQQWLVWENGCLPDKQPVCLHVLLASGWHWESFVPVHCSCSGIQIQLDVWPCYMTCVEACLHFGLRQHKGSTNMISTQSEVHIQEG